MLGHQMKIQAQYIVHTYLELEQYLQLRPWFARVGTFSIIADGPSRGDFSLVNRLGAEIKGFTEDAFELVVDRIVNDRGGNIYG